MEAAATSRRAQLVRMDDQDRVSQASSVATISYFPVKESDGKVQTFGKRCQAARRDPNCPVVIRGWLNKKDSSGLKLWKRRWFVLSNYCLFYYKDSREESVLGSIPLPSYKILFCTPRECKNRKFTFKVVHQGMRSYFFSADTQEDMLGWVRALTQSAAMEADSSMTRRCSSYQDFTQIGGSSESVDSPRSPSDGEGPTPKHRHVSRTLSEPSQLAGRRPGAHSEQRGRQAARHRNSSPSNRTPSPRELSRRRAGGSIQEGDSPPAHADMMGTGSLTSRGQLGSRPHTPVGRVDIRPHDDPLMIPQTLYYAPASPKLEFKSTPNTPVTERWQNLSKPTPTYGSVHHLPGGRKPLGKSYTTGAHADLLPPLPPSSRAAHAPHHPHHHHHHHHHHPSHLSVCVLPPAMAPKSDPREAPAIRPLESDADAVLTRLCGCAKLLQSLSVELDQLQMDKDGVHCALEVSRLQLEEWQGHGSRAQEEALTQKALLQEELVTIRARMCDVSVEMERVWSQYERMESELSVIRSHLQHICNFGMPQEQSQAQRELWMMEDILAGLKLNRDHFCFLLGLERHHMFQPHPGSPGSPTERLLNELPMDMELEPPARPPLPQELQEGLQSGDQGYGYTELLSEGPYGHIVGPAHTRGSSQPNLLNVKAQKELSDPQPGSKWIPLETTNQTKIKMSGEEQIERMKKNQERLINKKKPCLGTPGLQTQTESQSSETREEAPFPIRVTRVVTAVLPTSLVARRVSVEDPPVELDARLPEQIPPEMQQSQAEQSKMLNRSPKRLLLESPDQARCSKTGRQRHQEVLRSFKNESKPDMSRNNAPDQAGSAAEGTSSDSRVEERASALLTSDMDPDLGLTPEQREAKLRRVERIRERVIRSTVREKAPTYGQSPVMAERQQIQQASPGSLRNQGMDSGQKSSGDSISYPAKPPFSNQTTQVEDRRGGCGKRPESQVKFGNKPQHKGHSVRTKSKRPASPYHISSMTVYQKDGGKGFMRYHNKEGKKVEDPAVAAADDENSVSSDLRAKWFLSTNQWQGFIPLQIPGMDPLCNEEVPDHDSQPAGPEDVTDSTEMSSAVSESLEKMRENHSLFYKIACDISISDTDITNNDGNVNPHASSKIEEGEKCSVVESAPEEEASNAGRSSNQGSEESSSASSSNNNSGGAGKELHVYEEIPQKEGEAASRLENRGTPHEASASADADNDQALQGCEEPRRAQVDKERREDLKKSRSFSEENERGGGAARGGGSVSRSASFGKTRLTVLRTSL
ncbi:uncharacterized protein si:ch211-234p6.5 isoform X2 [Betta splendens]|uniref:Uncharacterized protein si:ch211-234p6.5 isoform X2 n=1 Tax=Betta splendens TaxID=158456 RepID=A0A6P7L476_BETSP|nr:uncharacterized protein si:ch211-234p6.5 isoform X2 [Betta splendens]